MSYFQDSYSAVRFPIAEGKERGLRNAQVGAIHAIGSHFTIHDKEPAIVVMPTGSGKTAILYLSSFVLRAKRVLIVTPSKLVRNQIATGFADLAVLKDNNIVSQEISLPRVYEVKSILDSTEKWDELKEYDVVVTTPNSAEVGDWYSYPALDLFDLILIDEAHHSPAHTWDAILRQFKSQKKILFTATPFRRDQKEIKGKIIYNYPISKAFEDKIFGGVEFIPVLDIKISADVSIAKEAYKIFQNDKQLGLEHFLMVRTNTKKHAKELIKIYAENTGLRLKRIDSSLPTKSIEATIKQLKEKQLDGVICVDMLGEGFDFPNLKIAAIHNPHKSLAITLQFIGRFARTNAPAIGAAKFIAIPDEISSLKLDLYREGAVWKDIIKEASESAIQNEIEVKETLAKFESKEIELEDDIDISMYSLKPNYHVKIYDVEKVPDIQKNLEIPGNLIEKHFVNEELSTIVLITKVVNKPKWMTTDDLVDVHYNLVIVYFDTENNLLYINSTQKTVDTYNTIATQLLGDKPKKLPLADVHKVLLDLTDAEIFNLGLRSKNAFNNSESYMIKSGSHVQDTIKPSDIVSYEGGHTFLRGKEQEGGEYKTIGYSSSSKVWSHTSAKVTDFVAWCKLLSSKIISDRNVVTNTNLDNISMREVYAEIPDGIVFASWHSKCYKTNLQYRYTNGEFLSKGSLIDLDIIINQKETDINKISYTVTDGNFEEHFTFTLADFHSRSEKQNVEFAIIDSNNDEVDIEMLINDECPISFFLKDFSSIILNEISRNKASGVSYDAKKINFIDWSDTDIQCELGGNVAGKMHIHDKLKVYLPTLAPSALLYDHGTGETADFILFKENANSIDIEFFHCKGAGDKMPGNRVNDVYEVCGQSIKSCYYANSKELQRKISSRVNRLNPSTFVIGNYSEVERLLSLNKIVRFKITAVQPGITKKDFQKNISEVIAAAEAYIDKGDNIKFEVLASE